MKLEKQDYEGLGFKCGIEIHQQLDTETKLFCNCPIDLVDETPDHKIERYLKSVKGETGKEDEAARIEAQKSKKFIYHYHHRNNCLVEIDEEPPHELNQEALNTTLKFAKMIDAEIPQEIQIMRKMVVDGSNTSGFQRTAMVGLNGQIQTEEGTVEIEDIELEEESASIQEKTKNKSVYDLSRLGIPLIEIGTDASIQNPKHAKEVATQLGMLLRSTMNVRRGLGTIRQDVNISIEEGARVEIKGFQEINKIDELIEKEVQRQKALVELGKKLPKQPKIPKKEVSKQFEHTNNEIISTVIENNGAVYAIKLPKLTGKMKQKISGQRYLALELVDYAKNHGVNGIIHTDEDISKYNLQEEIKQIGDKLSKNEEDVVAIIAAEQEKAENAIDAVIKRAQKIYNGEVPEETRNAEQDQTTTYLRPLPGSARMYPETDIPPVEITKDKEEQIEQNLPKTIEEKREEYSEEIGEELAKQITKSKQLAEFEKYKELTETKVVANTFTNTIPQLKDRGQPTENIKDETFQYIFQKHKEQEIKKGDIPELLKKTITEQKQIEEILENYLESRTDESEIEETIEQILNQKEDLIDQQGMEAQGPLMGVVMQEVDADGQTVSKILQQKLQEKTN